MPPKSASACLPPRRNLRTTARKSIRPPSSIATSVSPPSFTTIPTSQEHYEEPLLINSPNATSTPDTTAPASRITDRNWGKTLATSSGPVKCKVGSINVHNNAETVKSVPPENKTIHLETQNLMQSGDDAKTELVLSCLPHEKSETSIQPVAGPESGAGEVAAVGKGTRKVIRRTVRVVKRVIKRRVPKKELHNGSENQHLVENMENVVYPSQVTDSVIEKSDPVNKLADPAKDVIEKPNLVTEKLNIQDELKETPQISSGAGVSEPMIDNSGNDPIGFECMEARTSEVNVGSCVLEQVVAEKGDDQSPIMAIDEKSDDIMAEADTKDINMSVPDSVEDNKVQFAAKSTVESEMTEGIEDSETENALGDSAMENPNIDTVSKEDLGLTAVQNLGPVEEKHVLVEEKDGTLGNPESGNGQVDNHNVDCNEGLLLSGEMEALERRKRRKTEIFVGGLDKDVKEEDIRKAFEEAGTIMDVELVMNSRKTGKNKGFAFVRFSTAAEANNALEKYSKVEICGKQSCAAPVQGNDTIFLGSIDRNWKTEDVMQWLEKAGIVSIDKVTLKADPNNIERNRGFAFVEFETTRAAQNAFYKLQNKNVFGKNLKVRVAWAQPLIEPAEDEILKVKSVYAEYLPSSWNEKKVKEYFKRFGEIENVAHAKDLPSSRRNDFAFINYTTREAALACIEAFRKERLEDDGLKMTVSLAKPISMKKQVKHVSNPTVKQVFKETPKVSTATVKLHEPRNSGKYASSSYNHSMVDTRSSTTDELVHILRQQASTNHIPPRGIIGTSMLDNHFPLPGGKRPFPILGHNPLYLESRGLPRARFEHSNPIPCPSYLPHGGEMASFPYQQPGHGFTSESVHGRNVYPSHFLTRERSPPFYGNNNIYRKY